MNKEKRNRLSEANEHIKQAEVIVDNVLNDEQDSYDNIPESLQNSARGEEMEQTITCLEEVLEALSDVSDTLGDIISD